MRAIALLFHDVYRDTPSESGFRSDAADRYKLALPDFLAQLDGVARVRSDAPVLATRPAALGIRPTRSEELPLWGGCRALPEAAGADPPFLITVDDGGVSYYTVIADALETRGWRGHCFVSTDFIGADGFLDAAQIRELDRRGHLIGSHSASHPTRFSACSFDQMVREWAHSRRVLEDIVGRRVDVASVPGGYFSSAVARAACIAGIRVLFTSEPVTAVAEERDCTLIGRFTIRRGDRPDAAQRFLLRAPWARAGAWIGWNAKGLVKPVLGPSYMRISDWLHAARGPKRPEVDGVLGRMS